MKNEDFRKLAHRYIPGGAHTYSRGDDSFPQVVPLVFEAGEGAYLMDLEGNHYLDYGMALRAVTLGYSNPQVNAGAIAQIHNGNGLTRASRIEVKAAEWMCENIPGVEMVKFAKNGSSVTTAAVKLARAFTGRDHVVRCAQHPFFSYDDWFIGDTEMSCGVPEAYRQLTLRFDYNDLNSLEAQFLSYPDKIACVILEAATSAHPKPDFLQGVRNLCKKYGALMVVDEMITGFRWDLRGACHYYGIIPDLMTFGKAMANGFSVAAVGGRADVMELGGIFHEKERVFLMSSTHGAEMAGLGAFLATVDIYSQTDVTNHLWQYGENLITQANRRIENKNLGKFIEFGGLGCSPYFIVKNANEDISLPYRTLFIQEMAKSGVIMPWIALSTAHGETELEKTMSALDRALEIYGLALEDGLQKYLIGESIRPVFRKYNNE